MDLYSFKFIILVLNEIKNQLCNEFYVNTEGQNPYNEIGIQGIWSLSRKFLEL